MTPHKYTYQPPTWDKIEMDTKPDLGQQIKELEEQVEYVRQQHLTTINKLIGLRNMYMETTRKTQVAFDQLSFRIEMLENSL